MSEMVRKLVSEASFDDAGKLVLPGEVGLFDKDKLRGDEKHLSDAGGAAELVPELAPINPTERSLAAAAAEIERLKALLDNQGEANALVEGTVADVVADLGGKTDDELRALEAAEKDREKPRKGVIDAIKAALGARVSA